MYDLPSEVFVQTRIGRGRGLLTRRRIKAGSIIHTTQPLVSILSTSTLSTHCSSCHLSPPELSILDPGTPTPPQLKRCTACRVSFYCSPKCQKRDWTSHKEECTAHRALKDVSGGREGGGVMMESVRALGRICWARKKGGANGRDPDWWAEVEAMESHSKKLPEKALIAISKTVQQLQYYLSLSNPLSPSGQPQPVSMDEFGFTSASELFALVSAFQVNSFTLSSPSLTPIGVAISPGLALCNHSCWPNAVVVFPKGGEGMSVVAISDIQEGEEILTSYIDVGLPVRERREDLKRRYGFDCACSLCNMGKDKGWVDPRWCVRHDGCKRGKGLAMLPSSIDDGAADRLTCNLCGGEFTLDTQRTQSLVNRGKQLLKQEEDGNLDPETGLQSLAALIPSLLILQPRSSYPLLPLLRLQSLLLTPPTSAQAYKHLVTCLALSYQGSEQVYPPGHPTLAIILSEWAKVLIMETPEEWGEDGAERMTQGVVVLRKAVVACERGFGGDGGLVGMEMRGLLRGCEGELQLVRGR